MKKHCAVIAAIAILGRAGQVYGQASATATQVQGQVQTSFPTSTSAAGATASQGQIQSAQGGSGGSSHSSNSFGINNSFNGSEPIRYLPVPGVMPIENYQPSVFGSPNYADHGPMFISMRQLIGVMNAVDLNAEIEGYKSIKMVVQMMSVPRPKKSAEPKGKKKGEVKEKPVPAAVTFAINNGKEVNGGLKPVAVVSCELENPNKANSASLAMALGKKAQELGATKVVFTTEGSSKVLTSSGWGIGFSYSYAEVGSKPSDSGSVGSGGFGYSRGTGGYQNKIYLTAVLGN